MRSIRTMEVTRDDVAVAHDVAGENEESKEERKKTKEQAGWTEQE